MNERTKKLGMKGAILVIFGVVALLASIGAGMADSESGNFTDWYCSGNTLDGNGVWDGISYTTDPLVVNESYAGSTFNTLVPSRTLIVDGYIYWGDGDGKVGKTDAADVSNYQDGYQGLSSSDVSSVVPWDTNNLIIVESWTGSIRKVDMDTMTLIESYNPPGSLGFVSDPLIVGDTIYVGTQDGYIMKFDGNNLTAGIVDSYQVGGTPRVNTFLAYDNGYLYAGGQNNVMYQITASTMNLASSYTATDWPRGQVLTYQGSVYFGTDAGIVYQNNVSNINSSQQSYTIGDGGWVEGMAIADGYLYVTTAYGTNNIWQFNVSNVSQLINSANLNGSGAEIFSSPTVVDGLLHVGDDDGKLFTLNATNLEVLNWSQQTNDIQGPVVVAEGYRYWIDFSGDINQLLLWNETTPCIESWIQSNTSCDPSNYYIAYYDENACGTTENLPADNGTMLSCNIGDAAGPIEPPVTPPLAVVPITEPQQFNFKGLFESITILFEKVFSGEITKEDFNKVSNYWLELFITIIAFALIILAGFQFKKGGKKK